MKPLIILVAFTCMIAVACKKGKDSPQQPVISNEMVKVRLKLAGDITTSQSALPNGRKANDHSTEARTLRDSTLYVVKVMKASNWPPLYHGLFNNPDSMAIQVPAGVEYILYVTAYKRGTSLGLFYTTQNGLQVFENPINYTLKNRMDSVIDYRDMGDSLNNMHVTDPSDVTKALPLVYNSEIDAYKGSVTFTATSASVPVSVNLKRMSFGVQFSATNFTAGKLIADFVYESPWFPTRSIMLSQTVTPATINSQYHIFTAQDFAWQENVDTTSSILTKITWEKPDGSLVPVGSKWMSFKRNVLTNLHVIIPNSGSTGVQPVITETEFTNTETVNF